MPPRDVERNSAKHGPGEREVGIGGHNTNSPRSRGGPNERTSGRHPYRTRRRRRRHVAVRPSPRRYSERQLLFRGHAVNFACSAQLAVVPTQTASQTERRGGRGARRGRPDRAGMMASDRGRKLRGSFVRGGRAGTGVVGAATRQRQGVSSRLVSRLREVEENDGGPLRGPRAGRPLGARRAGEHRMEAGLETLSPVDPRSDRDHMRAWGRRGGRPG